MTAPVLPPFQAQVLAREYVQATPDDRRALYPHWEVRYGTKQAYRLFLLANALITWPADPTEFRANWSAPTVTDPEIREAVAALDDDQLRSISEALRANYEQAPTEIPYTWHLAKQMAGLA